MYTIDIIVRSKIKHGSGYWYQLHISSLCSDLLCKQDKASNGSMSVQAYVWCVHVCITVFTENSVLS